jgi:hypothetical protein
MKKFRFYNIWMNDWINLFHGFSHGLTQIKFHSCKHRPIEIIFLFDGNSKSIKFLIVLENRRGSHFIVEMVLLSWSKSILWILNWKRMKWQHNFIHSNSFVDLTHLIHLFCLVHLWHLLMILHVSLIGLAHLVVLVHLIHWTELIVLIDVLIVLLLHRILLIGWKHLEILKLWLLALHLLEMLNWILIWIMLNIHVVLILLLMLIHTIIEYSGLNNFWTH